jgi:hypothetical protein
LIPPVNPERDGEFEKSSVGDIPSKSGIHTMSNHAQSDKSGFLFVVNYDDDAERKRVEYLFNNWENGSITKPDGFVRLAADIDHDELYEELVSKVPTERVESYQLEEIDRGVDPDTVVIEKEINAGQDALEPFIEYILSKKKAVLQSPSRNEYEVYTKKGRAEVTYQLSEADGNTAVMIRIIGYSQAPTFLAEFFEAELEDYSQTQE